MSTSFFIHFVLFCFVSLSIFLHFSLFFSVKWPSVVIGNYMLVWNSVLYWIFVARVFLQVHFQTEMFEPYNNELFETIALFVVVFKNLKGWKMPSLNQCYGPFVDAFLFSYFSYHEALWYSNPKIVVQERSLTFLQNPIRWDPKATLVLTRFLFNRKKRNWTEKQTVTIKKIVIEHMQ